MSGRSLQVLLLITIAILAAPLHAGTVTVTGTSFGASEGTLISSQIVADVVDSDTTVTAANLAATIDWGDGVTQSGTVTFTGTPGQFTVSGSHTYADEGIFIVGVTVNDTKNSATGNGAGTATIAEADIVTAGAPVSASIAEGTPFNGVVANFSDTYAGNTAGDFTATIDWGDGTTTPGIVSGAAGAFSVSGSHTYADEGTYNLLVTLADDAPGTASAKVGATMTVTEADVLNGTTVAIAPTEGAAFSGTVANFTDTNTNTTAAQLTATIDWGDGVTNSGVAVSGSAGTFSVNGTHTYQEEGSYVLKVTLSEVAPGNATTTASGTIAVADAPLSGSVVAISPTAGTPFSGTVATFPDADPNGAIADYTATINWGDGTTTPGTIGAGFTVSGSHTYASGIGGPFTLSVTINDAGGATITRSAGIAVQPTFGAVPAMSPGLLALLAVGLALVALKMIR